jgi:hypothetical protein
MFKNLIRKLKEFLMKNKILTILIAALLFLAEVTRNSSVAFVALYPMVILAAIVIFKLSYLLFKKSKLAFIIIFALLTTAFYCKIILYPRLERSGFFWSEEERYFHQKIKEFKKSGKKEIMMKDLTNFEWENVCDIQP